MSLPAAPPDPDEGHATVNAGAQPDSVRGEYLPPGARGVPGGATGAASAHSRHRSLIIAVAIGAGALLVDLLVRNHTLHGYQLVTVVVLIPSVILHEVSHGFVAKLCGDDTAQRAGRLTLNPLPHIDPFGSVILPAMLTLSGVGTFGWAKPVPVDIAKLRHPRNQAVLVGLVGPFVNIVLAVAAGLAFHLLASPLLIAYLLSNPINVPPTSIASPALYVVFMTGFVNVLLAVFNLIPLPPLDGSSVIERFLPSSWLPAYYRYRTALIAVVFLVVFLRPSALASVFSFALHAWSHLIT